MTEEFTPEQEEAIREKMTLLKGVKDGSYSLEELGEMITAKRLRWFEEHNDKFEDFRRHGVVAIPGLIDVSYVGYMGINPADYIRLLDLDESHGAFWGEIHSKNFCPYLEACKRLGMDTRVVCERALEKPVQAVLDKFYPGRVKFYRVGYRPHQEYCEERFVVRLTEKEYFDVLKVMNPKEHEALMDLREGKESPDNPILRYFGL